MSGEEGVLKPSAAIFQVLVDRFDLVPAETLFVDDAAVNVDGARRFGLQAHHFVDADRLEAALEAVGLP